MREMFFIKIAHQDLFREETTPVNAELVHANRHAMTGKGAINAFFFRTYRTLSSIHMKSKTNCGGRSKTTGGSGG
jgi:hypothetical protein